MLSWWNLEASRVAGEGDKAAGSIAAKALSERCHSPAALLFRD